MSDYLTCEAGVSRGGEYVPCDKPAVSWAKWPDDSEWAGPAYPVCVFHTTKYLAVPLPRTAVAP
jgi:hypothetical protein